MNTKKRVFFKKKRKNERDNKFVRVEGNFVCKLVKKRNGENMWEVNVMPNFTFIDVNIGHFKLLCSQC